MSPSGSTSAELSPLSLHDALPISAGCSAKHSVRMNLGGENDQQDGIHGTRGPFVFRWIGRIGDRKSTRLNSSHPSISYAVFCMKTKGESRPNGPQVGLSKRYAAGK